MSLLMVWGFALFILSLNKNGKTLLGKKISYRFALI